MNAGRGGGGRAVVDYAFGRLGLHRVEIRCAADNHRSRAIPERLGFTQEGVLRESGYLNGRFVDMVVYGVLASEWRAGAAGSGVHGAATGDRGRCGGGPAR